MIITVPVHIKKMHHTKTIYKIIEKPVPVETSHFSNGYQPLGVTEGTPGVYGYHDNGGGYNQGGDDVYKPIDNGDKTDPLGSRHPIHELNYNPTGTDQHKEMPSTGYHGFSHEINGISQNPDCRLKEYRDQGHRGGYARGLVHGEDLRHRHAFGEQHGHQMHFNSNNHGPYEPDMGGGGSGGGFGSSGNPAGRHLLYPSVVVNGPFKYVHLGDSQHKHREPYHVYVHNGNVVDMRPVDGALHGNHFGERSRGHFGTTVVHIGKLKHGHFGELWRGREIPSPVVRRPHEHKHLVGYGFQGHLYNHGIRSPPNRYMVHSQNGYDDQNDHGGYGGSGGAGDGGAGHSSHNYPGHTGHNGAVDYGYLSYNGQGGEGEHSYAGHTGHNGGGGYDEHRHPGYVGNNGAGAYGDQKHVGHVVHINGDGGGGGQPVRGQNAGGGGGGYQVQENVVDYDGQSSSTEPPRAAQNAYPPVTADHTVDGISATGVRGRGDSLDGMSSVFSVSSPQVVNKNVYYTLDPVVPYGDVTPKSRA